MIVGGCVLWDLRVINMVGLWVNGTDFMDLIDWREKFPADNGLPLVYRAREES